MTDPLTTTNVDVDAVPEVTVQESQAPAGAAAGPLPTVGTNAVSEWAMWDPNLWWTDWTLPPDPRPSWEQWFDWVNQLQALTPALSEASNDWQTMISQFDESLRTVRGMRTDLASWTGPSATTMSQSLDRLEDSLTTKMAAIQNNPARLQELAQSINEAVPPMAALDAEYQQVLQDLNACRQVAERGQPIMMNLATQLLQIGTDLQNSVRTDNLAPQPVPPRPLTLTDGPQGPTNQLTQVAGASNLTGVSVTPGDQIPVSDLPTTAGATNPTDLTGVATAAPVAVSAQPGVAGGTTLPDTSQVTAGAVPGVAVTPTDPTMVAGTGGTAAPSTLAGLNAGSAAPTMPTTPVAPAGLAGAPAAAAPTVMPVTQLVTPMAGTGGVLPGGAVTPIAVGTSTQQGENRKEKNDAAPVAVRVPVPVVGVPDMVSGSTAVPSALRGRTGDQPAPAVVPTTPARPKAKRDPRVGVLPNETEPLEADAFTVSEASTGTVAPSRRP